MRPRKPGWQSVRGSGCGGQTIPRGPYFCTVLPEIEWHDPVQRASRRLQLPERTGLTMKEGLPLPLVSLAGFLRPRSGNAGLAGRDTRPRSSEPLLSGRGPRHQSSSVTRRDLASQTHRGCVVSAFAQRSHPSDLLPQSTWGLARRGCVLPVVCRGPEIMCPAHASHSKEQQGGRCLPSSLVSASN